MSDARYGGFWIRVCASILDAIPISLAGYLAGFFMPYVSPSLFIALLWSIIISFFVDAAYEIVLTKIYGGTLGKLLLRISVRDEEGNRITYGRSVKRYFSKYLSAILFGIGYFMIAWDERKQGLHDKMAKTIVVNDEQSAVPQWLARSCVVLTILIVVGYAGYIVLNMSWAIGYTLEAAERPLDLRDPFQDMMSRCDGRIALERDICLRVYGEDPAYSMFSREEKRLYCQAIHAKDERAGCLGAVAFSEENPAACESMSKPDMLRCQQVYNSLNGMKRLMPDTARQINGTLTSAGYVLGVSTEDGCVAVREPTFQAGQEFCMYMRNISGFATASDGLSWYSVDFEVRGSDGSLFGRSMDVQEGGHEFLPGGSLVDYALYLNLSRRTPGTYTYIWTFYDKVSQRGLIVSENITITSAPIDDQLNLLPIKKSYLGTFENGECVAHPSQYTTDDTACFVLIAANLTPDAEGLYWFDIGVRLANETGTMEYVPAIFKKNNRVRNSEIPRDKFVILNLEKFPPGAYSQQLIVHDYNGLRIAVARFNFTVEETPELLRISKLKIGQFIDGVCEGSWDAQVVPAGFTGKLCAEPYVENLTLDTHSLVHFDMDLRVVARDGTTLFDDKHIWGPDDGTGYLVNGALEGYSVLFPVQDMRPGRYEARVTVHDTLANAKGTVVRNFTVA